ncbi:MAG TPA: hypothetical protein VJ865_02735 [Gemmatimonadaceae bacterium]|nr:hypothetical protein [Gemmatimonadaceae bacterium]
MPLTTEDFPQADKLHQVGMVADAVRAGHTSDKGIEEFIGLASENRQGRYYRKTAENLGLITTHQNVSQLTELGRAFTDLATRAERRDFLATLLSGTPLFATIGQFIAAAKPSEVQLRQYITSLYPGALSTGQRRVSSVLSYLRDANLAVSSSGFFHPGAHAGGIFVKQVREVPASGGYKLALEGNDSIAPIPPGSPIFQGQTYTVEIDLAKHERASLIHRKLVSAKAAFLHARGLSAHQTKLIDLYSGLDKEIALYEMKSLSGQNFVAQMRRAVSQLYEYRYDYGITNSRMCIVTNGFPSGSDVDYVTYLESDRKMAYVWTEDFQFFKCREASAALMNGFAP